MPLSINPNANFISAATQAAFKTELAGLLNELRANGAAQADISGLKNRLINGDFRINQRGFTSVASVNYHFDRWYALTETGNVTIGQLTDSENGQPKSLRMTQPDVTAKRLGSAQAIESLNCRDLRGQAVTLRSRVRCSSSQAIRYAIIEWSGTADAPTKAVVSSWSNATFTAGNFFISTTTTIAATGSVTPAANTWADLTATATISNTANNLIVFIWTEGTLAQNGTLDMGRIELCPGSALTGREVRPMAMELSICQSYYETSYSGVPVGQVSAAVLNCGSWLIYSTEASSAIFKFFTRKRISPTVTIYAPLNASPSGNIRRASDGTMYSVSSVSSSDTTCIFNINSAVASAVYQFAYAADSEI